MLKAIVFDFDGVIVDSEPLHYKAFVGIVREKGLDFTYEEYALKYIGYDDRDAFRAMLTEIDVGPVDERDVQALGQRKRKLFADVVNQGVREFPGVRAFIDHLMNRIPIAIASGATRHDIDLILDKLDLGDRFVPIVSADDVTSSKPDPETYRRSVEDLARRHPSLDLTSADCLAIEDTEAGIRSARAAGLRTLGITHSDLDQDLHAADRVIGSFKNLRLDTLQDWYRGS